MHRSFLIFFAALAVSAQPNLPGMAAGILDQAKLAQQAVGLRDRDAAMDHIKQGLSLANEIQQNSPDAPRPILIPVYREIETTTTYTPVKHKDGEMSADRLKSNTSVRGVAGDVTTTKLDVMAAADRLRGAQASVESGDWKGADSALAAVGASVVVTQAQGNMPLNMARQNLELARMRALAGKYKDAAVPLRSAAQALGDFEKQCSGRQASDVESARQAILGYAEGVSRNHDGAADRIDGWLESLKQWTTNFSQ
jgi:hypothetical protein